MAKKKFIGKRDFRRSVEYAETLGTVRLRHCSTLEEADIVLPYLSRLHKQKWTGPNGSPFND